MIPTTTYESTDLIITRDDYDQPKSSSPSKWYDELHSLNTPNTYTKSLSILPILSFLLTTTITNTILYHHYNNPTPFYTIIN